MALKRKADCVLLPSPSTMKQRLATLSTTKANKFSPKLPNTRRPDNHLRAYCIGQWGPPPQQWHSHQVYYQPSNPFFKVATATDFALDHLHLKCAELGTTGVAPLLKEFPHETLYKLTTLILVPSEVDVGAVALLVQGLVKTFFLATESGVFFRADCIVSVRPSGGTVKLCRRDNSSKRLLKLSFPHITLRLRANLVSFEKRLAAVLEPLLPGAAKRLITSDMLDDGLPPNTMAPWTRGSGGEVVSDPASAFRAVLCLGYDQSPDVERLATLRGSPHKQATCTTSLAFRDSPGCVVVEIRDTWGHEMVKDWARQEGVLSKRTEGSAATHSAMPVGDKFGYTMRLTGPTQQRDMYGLAGRMMALGFSVMLTERAKGAFAMFFDLELKTGEEVEWNELHEATANSAPATMCRLYEGQLTPGCIASASDTVTRADGSLAPAAMSLKSAGKRGLHLVFPNVIVDKSLALALREEVLEGLIRDLGEGPFVWNEALDASVYNGAGLRVLGGHKSKKVKGVAWLEPIRSPYAVCGVFSGLARDAEEAERLRRDPGLAMWQRNISRFDADPTPPPPGLLQERGPKKPKRRGAASKKVGRRILAFRHGSISQGISRSGALENLDAT
jgi:hypothetical protein